MAAKLPVTSGESNVSWFMKRMLTRLAEDWQEARQHRVALAEALADPHPFQVPAYKASGWARVTVRHA